MNDNVASDISYLPAAGRDQNVKPLLNPSGIMIAVSPPRQSSYTQPSHQQDDVGLRQVPTISQPSTATNSDSNSANTLVRTVV